MERKYHMVYMIYFNILYFHLINIHTLHQFTQRVRDFSIIVRITSLALRYHGYQGVLMGRLRLDIEYLVDVTGTTPSMSPLQQIKGNYIPLHAQCNTHTQIHRVSIIRVIILCLPVNPHSYAVSHEILDER